MSTNSSKSANLEYDKLSKKLLALEKRVKKLESGKNLDYKAEFDDSEGDVLNFNIMGKSNSNLEFHFGEYGLAWLGSIVLFFGIAFFVQYLQVNGYNVISALLGFASVAIIFLFSYYLRNSSPHMTKVFKLNAYLLGFYVTFKLHFLTSDPLIVNKTLGLGLLLIIVAIYIYKAIRIKHATLAGFSIILIAIIAILSDSTHIMLSLAAALSVIGVLLLYKHGWIRLVFLSIFMSYFIILMWMISNPFMGHQLQIVSSHQFGYLYIYCIAGVFSLIALMPPKEDFYSVGSIIGSLVFNGLGFIFVMSIYIFTLYFENYVLPVGLIASYCIVYSIFLKTRSNWDVTASIYALCGFFAISICIYGIYNFPNAYFLLAIQSLLVVSMAIWFRSKFIVIMNCLLLIILLIIYLYTHAPDNAVNISFSIVALVTARILNWKKDRLTIQSEIIRNFYLVIAFLMVLYTLNHLMDNQYITLSWTVVAVILFGLSILLKNVKYRYMALASMIAAALYLFIVDLARIELIYRVIAMLFLAVISIGLSFYYSKNLKKDK